MRWITDKLATAPYGDTTIPDDAQVLDVRDLIDRDGNSVEVIADKIQEGVAYLKQDLTLVVCCDYGISRSNSIAAGILALYENQPLSYTVRHVLNTTKESAIKVDMLNTVWLAMENLTKSKLVSEQKQTQDRILITGGNGFIGQKLQKQADNDYQFVVPGRQSIDLLYDTIPLDLLVKEQGITAIIHLANPRIYSSSDALGQSLIMLKNILDICVHNQLYLIWLSGWEVYSGYRSTSLLADENLHMNPIGSYGYSKMLAENLIQQYQQQYDLQIAILRSSPVYGASADKPRFIKNFLDKARRGQLITTHHYENGEPALDLLHIDDLIRALQKVIAYKNTNVFNIGGGELVKTRQVAEWFINYFESNSQIQSHHLTRYVGNILMDSTKAQKILGWQPRIHWTDGLQHIIQTHEDQHL